MFTVMLSAFRKGHTMDANSIRSMELASLLIQSGYNPEVVAGFFNEGDSLNVTYEQSFAVRVDTYGETIKLAELAYDAFQQDCVLVIDVLERMKATMQYPDGSGEDVGYFRRHTEQPAGNRSQWRGSWWTVEERA